MARTDIEKLREVLELTRIYRENEDICLREARCLGYQLAHIMVPMDETDGIAGRYEHGFVGFSSQAGGYSALGAGYTYYFKDFEFINAMQHCAGELTAAENADLQAAQLFWREENTSRKLDLAFAHRHGYVPAKGYPAPGVGNCDCRVAGTNLDFEKLITLGFDGLEEEIDGKVAENGSSTFYQALKMWIESLRQVCARYRRQALELAAHSSSGEARRRFLALADALEHIQHQPPQTFLEGVQLMWIYSVCCDLMNYGRMDDYLGPLYAAGLDKGTLTEEEGIAIILALYKHFREINKIHDCRVIIGGVGRKHPQAADRLAMAIMEATRRFREAVPQLTLRYYTGMDEAVFEKAMQVNAEGVTFPILYSDDTNVPAVQQVYGVTLEEAQQYVPFGCGEYVLAGYSVGTPNNGINALKALDLALHNGRDSFHNVACGPHTGELAGLDSFEKLYQAVLDQLQPVIERFAEHKFLNYQVAGENAPYLHLSLLLNDCVGRGKPVFQGGVRYLNASSETFGVISCADSLTAIQELVFRQGRLTLEELVQALDSNFEGYEEVHRLCLDAPKYGNDNDLADGMAQRLFNDMARMTIEAGEKAGLHRYNIVSVNNSMSAEWGNFCAASACGRKKGSPMANANGPSLGADKCGITALLNSMSKFDNTCHVGVINNVRFTKELFAQAGDKVAAVLKAFFQNGGVQANLCVVGREDLENAMVHPENYQNLMVRIGGFSARFVTLSPIVQREILERTTYDA